ncbi:MAG: sulfotransferase family protein [Gammaproteobacteria bacterium]
MSLKVIGAGVGRTGTNSLKLALEHLLEGPCYHMHEVFPHKEDIPVWHAAARGEMPDWNQFLKPWRAVVDWPASAFWEEISSANTDALILLSHRDADAWWASASNTIFPASMSAPDSGWRRMIFDLFGNRFTADIENERAAIDAYHAHNRAVRDRAPQDRLLEWQPGDGWEPICDALELPIPDEPFPHVNSTAAFKARQRQDKDKA